MNGMYVKMATLTLATLALLLSPACSSTIPAPTLEPTFEPVSSSVAQTVKIAVPCDNKIEKYSIIMKRINDSIASARQSVQFEIQAITDEAGTSDDEIFMNKAKKEMAAGAPTADAYLLAANFSEELFDAGLTMDVMDLVRQNAPVFHSKYCGLFPEPLKGIPTRIFNRAMWSKEALMLRDDFVSAGSGISTVEGLFGFIDDTIIKPKEKYTVLAYEKDLMRQWVVEKGYYVLENFGLSGMLCCGIDDPGLTPAPIENIPGFADFVLTMKELRKAGAILYPFDVAEGKECIAYVFGLSYYYYPSPYLNVPIASGHFTAQLFSPDKPGYFSTPGYINELAVPKLCGAAEAASVVGFVEWMYANQDNYDSIVYGEKGVDFADEPGRYTPLKDGKPLQGAGYSQLDGLFFTWPAATELTNFDYYRLPSSTPENVDKLLADGLRLNVRFSFAQRIDLNQETYEKLSNPGDDIKVMSEQRNDILYGLIDSDPVTFTKETLASSLESLKKLNNDWLCEQYAALIQRIENGAK